MTAAATAVAATARLRLRVFIVCNLIDRSVFFALLCLLCVAAYRTTRAGKVKHSLNVWLRCPVKDEVYE
jgi:hypothetical protein